MRKSIRWHVSGLKSAESRNKNVFSSVLKELTVSVARIVIIVITVDYANAQTKVKATNVGKFQALFGRVAITTLKWRMIELLLKS